MNPKLGDIVVYVGNGTGVWAQRRESGARYLVCSNDSEQCRLVSVPHADFSTEEIWVKPESVRVVAVATYRNPEEDLPTWGHWQDFPNTGQWLVVARNPKRGWEIYLRTNFDEMVWEAEETLEGQSVQYRVIDLTEGASN
jgi:hypothetical protein